MHDLRLGGPVDIGVRPDATHEGSCSDGVYDCTRCWNTRNGGKGTSGTCEMCKAHDVLTKVIRDFEEPELFAACEPCRVKYEQARQRFIAQAESELDDYYSGYED